MDIKRVFLHKVFYTYCNNILATSPEQTTEPKINAIKGIVTAIMILWEKIVTCIYCYKLCMQIL